MKYYFSLLFIALFCNIFSLAASEAGKKVAAKLQSFVENKSADIGLCVIYDGQDTVRINADRPFPMASVYKFPQALYIAEFIRHNNMTLEDSCQILPSDMHPDTWSPMRDRFGTAGTVMSLADLLSYSLQQSDNNACDVLFRIAGGPTKVDEMLKELGYANINVRSTEDEMHKDTGLCRLNSSTPEEMARLMDFFNSVLRNSSAEHRFIAGQMENCETGRNRLVSPVSKFGNCVIGHKTGTGDMDKKGRITAINDAGYVNLADGHRYSIAVFIADSRYDMKDTEKLIADISEIAFEYYKSL